MNDNIYEVITNIINVFVALPFAIQIFAYIVCGGLKKAATDIHNTNKEIFRSIKLRYTNSTKLGIPLEDARSYVVKYLYSQGGPFRLPVALEKLSSFIYCVALMGTTALFLRDIADLERMIAIFAASFCFFIFRTAFSVHRQMELAVEFTVDYLENTLKHRLAPEKERVSERVAEIKLNAPKIAASKADDDHITLDQKKSKQSDIENKTAPIIKLPFEGENSDIIEAVLQEFLA